MGKFAVDHRGRGGADADARDLADARDSGCRGADLLAATLHDGSVNWKRTPRRVIPVTGDGAAIVDLSALHRGGSMPGGQWARLRADASVPLRRGAWYRVLRLTPSDAVLDVNQRPINV